MRDWLGVEDVLRAGNMVVRSLLDWMCACLPGCSWITRLAGMECVSYFGSCLCLG